jgi:hypothetical protein
MGVSRIDRCYEPCAESLWFATSEKAGRRHVGLSGLTDHDFVIDSRWRNKLKDRPN